GNPDPATFTGELTVSEALGLFRHDIMKYEAGVNTAVKVPLAQHEFDALVSFHYNTGAIGRASFVKKLNAGDRAGALRGIMDWRKPAEIIKRRTAERDLFKTGSYPAPVAMLYPATADGRVQWREGRKIDLEAALAAPQQPVSAPKPIPAQHPPEQQPAPAKPADGNAGLIAIILAGIATIIAATWEWIAGLPCNIMGVLCQ